MRVVISSGHGKYVRGASGYIDEVDQARRVVEQTAEVLRTTRGIEGVTTYHDDVSKTQDENLNRIVDFHNSQTRDLDISVHFNAYETTAKPMGCEVLYVSQSGLEVADQMVDRICIASGLTNRGPKKRTDLFFLNNTNEPAILVETCFVDSSADVNLYNAGFFEICEAIAAALVEGDIETPPDPSEEPLAYFAGRCSWFGGPEDTGVSPSEGLAFIYNYEDRPDLFLDEQPPGTTGLARRLNPDVFYVACRWDYDITSKEMLAREDIKAMVRANGREFLASPADWGPHEEQTGRAADLSLGLLEALGIDTDDNVEVIYPAPPNIAIEPEPIPEPEVPTVTIRISADGPVNIKIVDET